MHMKVEIGKAKTDHTIMSTFVYYTDLLKAVKKERRHIDDIIQKQDKTPEKLNYEHSNSSAHIKCCTCMKSSHLDVFECHDILYNARICFR